MRPCRAFRSALRALCDGELALERTLELEAHARECRACGLELERQRALERALLALPPAPLEELDLQRNVRAVLARLDAPAARARRPLRRILPWAAAATLAGLLGWRFLRPAASEPAPLAQAPEPELDRARLEAARAAVRAALHECRPEFVPERDDARAFADEVDARGAGLVRAGWPLAALVRNAAADDDPALAGRALRWLGVRGESASRLRAALGREELAASALAALLDLGAPGVDELRRAPQGAALRARVLQQLARGPRPELAPWLEDELARGRAGAEERAALLEALSSCGSEAVPALLRLASRGVLDLDLVLERLGRIEGADEALAGVLSSPRADALDGRVLLLAVAEVGTPRGWEWVEREAREGRHESDALLALSRGTPEALAALLRLRAASGASPSAVQRTLERVLRERPDSAAALARSAARTELAGLCEIVCATPEPALVPALVGLAGNELLPEPDRRWALLLAAEQGRAEDLPLLGALFPLLRERTLQAACLIALHALGGKASVEQALELRPPAVRRRVGALFDDPASTNRNATTLARLLRAIESSLPAPQP